MVVLLAAIGGLLTGIVFGFVAAYALFEHLRWKNSIAIATAALVSLPIGVLAGGLAAAGVILVMYPEFDWNF